MTPFDKTRLSTPPRLPQALHALKALECQPCREAGLHTLEEHANLIQAEFPLSCNLPVMQFIHKKAKPHSAKRVGVLFSGGQAPGGHNVVAGLFDALKELNAKSQLFGFLQGPSGLLKQQCIEITSHLIDKYRNQGGFDLLGSSRTKVECVEQFQAAAASVNALNLDGLLIIGGDDSNTNAAFLAEYFLKNHIKTAVVGVPKTIDGDLKNKAIEISFGFDTASKLYAHLIGNIQRDALSAKKYYHFIKLMGRTASHLALECALKTHANYTLIGEEIAATGKTLHHIVAELCDVIEKRWQQGREYGVILLPEGVLEFIPEYKSLIQELNVLLHNEAGFDLLSDDDKIAYIVKHAKNQDSFALLPKEIQLQLLLDRDPHGNVNVSKIESERLIIELIQRELADRSTKGSYHGSFNAQPHFFGYEGRACLPSIFDSNYCYALGYTATLLIDNHLSGYMAVISDLKEAVEKWQIAAMPLTSMLTVEVRKGKNKLVVQKTLVDLTAKPFLSFKAQRDSWKINDDYLYPEPIQFFGPASITDNCSLTLQLENSQNSINTQI